MAKTNQKGKERATKKDSGNKAFIISMIVFAVLVSGCVSYLLWDRSNSHQYGCMVLGVDQVSGLVGLECYKK